MGANLVTFLTLQAENASPALVALHKALADAIAAYAAEGGAVQVHTYVSGQAEIARLTEHNLQQHTRIAELEALLAQRPQPLPPLTPPTTPPLAWPTEHRIVTQAFGARPEYYAQFGLPGHEGVDLRAPEGSRIHAAASGVVTRVESGNKAYGVSVRHSWNYQGETYECVYAHGVPGSVRVKVGDAVTVGQVLMLADSTGNAQGSHLHFSLKRVGATAAGYRDTAGRKWPFDIVSPVKFLGI